MDIGAFCGRQGYLVQGRVRRGVIRHFLRQDREFVAADACHGVGLAHEVQQAMRPCGEYRVRRSWFRTAVRGSPSRRAGCATLLDVNCRQDRF